MPDLKDGESTTIQGSARHPYVLKNVGGIYSCTCQGWRFQSLPIERRTCRHLRQLRGDGAEHVRVGMATSRAKTSRSSPKAPPLLLAESWRDDLDPRGYLMSEKLDGIRAFWDGKQFLSRQGNRLYAPNWFTVGLPLEPLDGELWIGRKKFQRTISIVKRHDEPDLWNEVRFVIFDAPADEDPFEKRLELIDLVMNINRPPFAVAHPHVICSGLQHLQSELDRIEALGGEGLMLRQPGSAYEAGRSRTLLKVKRFHDAEARVIGYENGQGRHKGRVGALVVEMANGVCFSVGSGLTDAQREVPPPINSIITFRYQELTDHNVPRFPTFVRVRSDLSNIHPHRKGETLMASSTTKRRFECVDGGSDKFYEVAINGNEVEVCFGRNGTNGQRETKTFKDAESAQKHVQKKIDEKVRKGYVEVN